jgi:hypothetical protein
MSTSNNPPPVTAQQVEQAGSGAVALVIDLMQRNSRETAALTQSLYDSVQRDLDEARATITRIHGNVAIVLRRPHTDAMIADAIAVALAGHDLPDPDACE